MPDCLFYRVPGTLSKIVVLIMVAVIYLKHICLKFACIFNFYQHYFHCVFNLKYALTMGLHIHTQYIHLLLLVFHVRTDFGMKPCEKGFRS